MKKKKRQTFENISYRRWLNELDQKTSITFEGVYLVHCSGSFQTVPLLPRESLEFRIFLIILQVLLLLQNSRIPRRRERQSRNDDGSTVSVAKVQTFRHFSATHGHETGSTPVGTGDCSVVAAHHIMKAFLEW